MGIGIGSAFLRAGPLPSVRLSGEASYGPLTANGNATLFQGQNSEIFQNYGLRYMLIDGSGFKLATYLTVTHYSGPSDQGTRITDRLGLAFMSIGEKWTWDGSISLYGHQLFPNVQTEWSTLNVFDTALGSELGVGYQLDPNHAIRLGLMGPIQVLSHFWKLPKGTLKSTVGALGDQAFVQIEYAFN